MTNRQAPSAEFGAALRSARGTAGLTQEQLAGLSTVSVRAIRNLERGQVGRPRKDTIRLLADAMRLSDTRRAALELAVEGASTGKALRDVYSAEFAFPPTPLRSLFGRGAELRALDELLGSERERLVTIVGLPGVGKSRLAQEAALRVHAHGEMPVLWLPTDRPDDVLAQAPGRPQSAMVSWVRSLIAEGGNHEELAAFFGDKATLLVLDGHEVSPAASPTLMHLLQSCRRLKVLVTARRSHHFAGGRLLPLAPLPTTCQSAPAAGRPQVGDSLSADRPAVELMLSYVSHMRPDLLLTDSVTATVAEVCEALDGIPQALEAAASWLLLYSLDQLLAMARERPLTLVDGPASLSSGTAAALGDLLSAAVTGLRPRGKALLAAAVSLDSPWTVEEVARALGVPPVEAAQDVHALLLHGLIRQLPAGPGGAGGRPGRFAVLHLVRELVAAGGYAADEGGGTPPSAQLVASGTA
ncbi:helix-turn-helix domain-containing protein (plasmid) [Streptomyces sp. HUAS TT3]|uniref:helix-turn-helix domain-containing protein n=1 Tax=Streptomyces sp. HUAS TT3 TaxID=3447510 RepID=UPI003F655038